MVSRAVLPDESLDLVTLGPLAWLADNTQERATDGHERDNSTLSGPLGSTS
jgi:hypothetical protein